jgi:uroporphyrinogen III methyltransferase/synthase
MKSKGIVYLVGAGPGDVGLLTLRGAELLQRADVVVYDALVNPNILKLASKQAELIYGGKRASAHQIPQGDLNRLLVAKAKEGKTVVRLKGGDPYTFGRGGEEAEELATANVPFEVVPGISSAVAVPNYAGIPLTHRDHSSAFSVITGHEDPEKEEKNINWEQVARTPGTKVILMGTERIGEIGARLIEHGMAGNTPVAMVQWGTLGRQKTIEGTLSTIGAVIEKEQFGPPSVAVVGDVVKLRSKLNWFEKRSLFGKRVVVTRTREQASELSRELAERGAEVLEIPTIKVGPPTDAKDLADAMVGLNSYDWLVFTSPNGVAKFFEYFFRAFDDMRDIGGVRIAAVGPATAAKLKELHLKVDLMPDDYVGKKIADAFANFESIENLYILLLRAEVANADLPKQLEELGAIVDDVAIYKTIPETEDLNGAAATLHETGADWLTFTSASTVEHFHARFNLPELLKKFPATRTASIGPETSKALAALGVKPTIEARPHTIEGIVKSIEGAE